MADCQLDFSIQRLGECRIPSPMKGMTFVSDEDHVMYYSRVSDVRECLKEGREPPSMELAGPRDRIYFDPSELRCGIVTCGGLCPGLNDVIRAIVLSLYHHYGVKTVYGFRYGYEGLVRPFRHEPAMLTPDSVQRIHEFGGTILGTSRGPQDAEAMVATLRELGISILFAIGGDGTLKGARLIAETALRQGLRIAVIGIPKTIDNDISFLQKDVALDQQGNLSGACTTSGLFGKIHGRVGDSPIIGAGLYCDGEAGAAGATVRGEEVIKTCGSFSIVEMMRQGRTPQEAVDEALRRLNRKYGNRPNFQVAYIALRKDGEIAAGSLKPGFKFALFKNGKNEMVDVNPLAA